MPKHVPSEHYLDSPYRLVHDIIIHPETEHHDHPTDIQHYQLPTVFLAKKGEIATFKYPGPGVLYIIEGEGQYEDTKKPGNLTGISVGSVIHVEEGAVLRWYFHSAVKGFATFWVPVSIKSFDEFNVVPE